MTNANYGKLFMAACIDLAQVSEKLGLESNEGGAAPIIAAIEVLQAKLKQFEWQPIASAPRDGSEILVLFKRIGCKQVAWTNTDYDHNSEYAHWHVDDNKYRPYPLRAYNEGDELGWMPIPKLEVKV